MLASQLVPWTRRYLLTWGCLLAALPVSAGAQIASREEGIVTNAAAVLNEFMALPSKQIPASMLADAQAIAIIPNVVKGGLVVGVRHGRGVVLTRDANGQWQLPTFVSLTGGSIGWQAGVQSTDLILVFRTQRSVQNLMRGKLTIGVDAAAAAGPVGRQAGVATDARLAAEIYTYSRSRGLFAGVSVDGAGMQIDQASHAIYYQPHIGGPAAVPATAQQLVARLNQYSTGQAPAGTAVQDASPPQFPPALPATSGVPAGDFQSREQQGRRELITAARQLTPQLDAAWNDYLMLSKLTAQGLATQGELELALTRFEQVARNPQYAALIAQPAYTATWRALRNYLAVTRPAQGRLSLPAPPAVAPVPR